MISDPFRLLRCKCLPSPAALSGKVVFLSIALGKFTFLKQVSEIVLAVAVVLSFACVTCGATEESDAEGQESPIRVEIEPRALRTSLGHRSQVQIRISNTSQQLVELYDPSISRLLWPRRAVVLAILHANGDYIGDLLMKNGGSATAPSREDWTVIAPGESIECSARFVAGRVPDPDGGAAITLAPGKYLLEFRIFKHAIAGRPDLSEIEEERRTPGAAALRVKPSRLQFLKDDESDDTPKKARISYSEWLRKLPGQEICRSNRIELEIMPLSGK